MRISNEFREYIWNDFELFKSEQLKKIEEAEKLENKKNNFKSKIKGVQESTGGNEFAKKKFLRAIGKI